MLQNREAAGRSPCHGLNGLAERGPNPPSTGCLESGAADTDHNTSVFAMLSCCLFDRIHEPMLLTHVTCDLSGFNVMPSEKLSRWQGGRKP